MVSEEDRRSQELTSERREHINVKSAKFAGIHHRAGDVELLPWDITSLPGWPCSPRAAGSQMMCCSTAGNTAMVFILGTFSVDEPGRGGTLVERNLHSNMGTMLYSIDIAGGQRGKKLAPTPPALGSVGCSLSVVCAEGFPG